MVGVTGIEPVTSSLSGTRSNRLSYTPKGLAPRNGGGNRIRTGGIQLAKLALYQLSYAPSKGRASRGAEAARLGYCGEQIIVWALF